jgi:4-alpha-glucanotransferase
MDLIKKLAELVGLKSSYTGTFGDQVEAKKEAQQALLIAMGYKTDEKSLLSSIETASKARCTNILPVVHIAKLADLQPSIKINVKIADDDYLNGQLNKKISWEVVTELNKVLSGNCKINELLLIEESSFDDNKYCQYQLPLPVLEQGYHQLSVTLDDISASCALIFAPKTCYSAQEANTKKVWGYTAQLYSLRSKNNWGIGDFTDLVQLVEKATAQGASTIGINPLHPLYQNNPAHRSPYSPSSRCFLNPIYIDVTAIPNYTNCKAAQNIINSTAFKNKLQQVKGSELIDYPGVAALKFDMIELLFSDFCHKKNKKHDKDKASFTDFKKIHGEDLLSLATFDALYEHFRNIDENAYGWTAWPTAYQQPDSAEVTTFKETHAQRIDYFAFVQWIAHSQLTAVKQTAKDNGMKIGLYLDLAVGCDGSGAEVWADQKLYVAGASIGAPPDAMNALGQNWGLTPMNPTTLQEQGYHPLVKALRSNMQYAGALRIDHILGLMRQYWVAPGMAADEGIYITFPLDDILSIIALESRRNECIVIGEDLGNVPDGFSEIMMAAGLLSFKVMFFERWESGLFKRPELFPEQSIATISTHDLPTLAGWWSGNDLQWREKLDLYPTEEAGEQDRNARATERSMLIDALTDLHVIDIEKLPLQEPASMNTELSIAVQKYLATASSHLQLIPLEDAIETQEQVNIPGTIDQHPNWLQKLPVSIEDFCSKKSVCCIADAMKEARPVS